MAFFHVFHKNPTLTSVQPRPLVLRGVWVSRTRIQHCHKNQQTWHDFSSVHRFRLFSSGGYTLIVRGVRKRAFWPGGGGWGGRGGGGGKWQKGGGKKGHFQKVQKRSNSNEERGGGRYPIFGGHP